MQESEHTFTNRIDQFYLLASEVTGVSLTRKPLQSLISMPMRTWERRIETVSLKEGKPLHHDQTKFVRYVMPMNDAAIPYDLVEKHAVKELVAREIPFGKVIFHRDHYGAPEIRLCAYVVDRIDPLVPDHYATCYSKAYGTSLQRAGWEELYRDLQTMDILPEFESILYELTRSVKAYQDREAVEHFSRVASKY